MDYFYESELTIKDLAENIRAMSPITISVNGGEYFWSDDVDLTNIDDSKEEKRLLEENMKQYYNILSLDKIVVNISYDIVDYHHSIVRITTK